MIRVGVDEAGVGPAFGSLWAAAVYIPEGVRIEGLADSKKLTEKRRVRLRHEILQACHVGTGEVTQEEIDRLGLGEARRLVFDRALDSLAPRLSALPDHIVVDGTLFRPWRGVKFACLPRAHHSVPCVSAASIIAKTERDAQVIAQCDSDPDLDARYGLRSNKGYLSKRHVEGIREHGYHALHRRSFHIRALDAASEAGASSHAAAGAAVEAAV